jgi:hypothetical protein
MNLFKRKKTRLNEAKTIPAKYIFLDVVSFTYNRSTEAQSDIVHILNQIVKTSIDGFNISIENLILIPTGDGLCIALLNIEDPFDVHLQIALKILAGVYNHNQTIKDDMRKFQIRIGLSSNTDNLVTDINGKRNLAGAGINMASRVMNISDGNQILMTESVYDTLRYREKYLSSFKNFQKTVKHGINIPVYQFISTDTIGLNSNIPQAFQTPQKVEPKLNMQIAFYFALAILNRTFLIQKNGGFFEVSTSIILLWFLSLDAEANANATEIDAPYIRTYKAKEGASLEQQFEYYNSIDFPVRSLVADYISRENLSKYNNYFESSFGKSYCFINSKGIEKLKLEWPSIWASFELEKNVIT